MINWDRIAELQTEVGEEEFAEVLEVFFEEVEETLEGLSGLAGEDFAKGLHFLKGAALNIGMEKLSVQCRDVEEALKAYLEPTLGVDDLRKTLDASQVELREMIG